MTDNRIYEGDIGVRFTLNTNIDLSDATLVTMKVTNPNGTVVEWIGTVDLDDSMVVEYISKLGDLNVVGKYLIYAYVEWGPNSVHSGKGKSFKVYELFK